MAAPAFVQITLTAGSTARAEDLQAMFAGIASFLGNDTVTTDTIVDSGGINVFTTDGKNLSVNAPNVGGSGYWAATIGGIVQLKIDSTGFHVSLGGVHVFTIDNSGNVVAKGTLTASGFPT